MKIKLLEIRDEMTFLPVMCVDMNPDVLSQRELIELPESTLRQHVENMAAQRYLLRRMGYACDRHPNIAITHLRAGGDKCWNDPYGWKDRTYAVAHDYIIKHWHELRDGDVVDVQFILGERPEPAASERLTSPL